MQQAYRIVRVATTRHHIVDHEHTSLSFYKDRALVEFEERYIFVKCVHIDFNGQMLGPVLDIFAIPDFKGEKAVASLPVYPIEFCEKAGITELFVERGKVFAKAGGIEHMHYRGLTLPAEESSKLRDDVDSQVVIDFEEAINRYPEWMPPVEKTVLEESGEQEDSDNEEEWMPRFRKTQNRSDWKCIPGCCSRERAYHDESIDDRTRNDYMTSQANENSTTPSAAIVARTFSDMNDHFKDDDFLIMSYRVFGFVLRSRKWHQLDLADATPAETNSDGFDQLVLPTGHKDIVTSMITKHLRDKRSATSIRTQTDIVRGKGRGVIMLLHGVPGVGKTSTAECLAGAFNRPLFQITSGDLGITAGDVDENLEENFSLANRWNCILLIDEADVFLAQRSKEDFVQNSLVAAFSSRIHITLYYPPLDRQQTLEIFKKNWERILLRSKEDNRRIDIDQSEITQFAMDYYDNNKQGRWNGRQIRNAFQSALAMAEFEVLGIEGVNQDDNVVSIDPEAVQTVKLGKKHFEEVAKAYKGFVDYLNKVYGAGSARRARENMWRFDDDDESTPKRPTALSQRLRFAGDPMQQQAPRNLDPGYGPMQNPRGYGPSYETPSNYGPMNPPRGMYSGPHEYQYPSSAFPPRSHGVEQGVYSDHPRASEPSANYQPAQPQAYGTRAHPASQHEMQPSQPSWDGSSRDVQSGVYSYRPGEQNLGAATGPNIRWGGDAEAGGSQQGP
ncbi:hypothetical protein E8E14_012443 [Neopestalotiopsis sp. 37M]|nr:hypothetical protein E8E14_012443 [Neopestalotiopsis sp. 37M]